MKLSADKKAWLVALKQEDIDKALLEDAFAKHYDKKAKKIVPAKYNWSDELSLAKGECHNTENIARTNAGLFIFNKFIVENLLEHIIPGGYWNEPIDKKVLGKFESYINTAIEDDELTVDAYGEYQDRLQWLLSIHAMVCGSFTPKTSTPNKKVLALRDKLYKENKEVIENGDAIAALKIEDQLLKVAHKELEGDPGMELFDSGARANFDNNYKCNVVTRGPVFDPVTGKYIVAKSSFMEGIAKEDIPTFASTVVQGQYPKSVGTAVGGYTVKKFYAEYQNLVVGPKGSDCHSKRTLEILITDKNKNSFKNRYIMEGSKVIRLDAKTLPKYVGKKVHLRTPMFCTTEHICNVCFGDSAYNVGIKNVGLTASKIGSNFVNLGMKAFHDTSMKLNEVDPKNILL